MRLFLVAALLWIMATPAQAGFDEGVAAYERDDYAAALREFLPLARRGHRLAQFNVGLMYQHGLGVEPNLTEAVKWYGQAAENGDAQAQRTIGDLHIDGIWGQVDHAAAAQWYEMAAAQGDAEAQRKLGALYLHGRGVAQDRDAAVTWLRRAAAQGDDEARNMLDDAAVEPEGSGRTASRESSPDKGVTSVASCEGGFPDAPYDINVKIEFPEVPIDHSRSIKQLSSLHGRANSRILGLMKPDLRILTLPHADGAVVGDAYCFWITGFDVTLRYKRVDVYVAREYKQGSCAYNAILDHEQEHVRVARRNLLEYAPRIRSTLTSLLIPTGAEPVMVPSVEQAKVEVRAISDELLKPVYEEMVQSLHDGQAALDTPQEYARVRSRCRRW